MRLPLLASILCVATTGCVITGDSSMRVSNRSDFEIDELYVTDVASANWGPNLLRGDALLPGESMDLAIDCGTYDALLVDETGETCEIDAIDLCFDNADWVIRNSSCSVFAARAKAAAAGAAETK